MTKKRNGQVIIFCLLFIYAAYVFYCQLSYNEIEKNGKYTIAKVTDFKMNFRNGYTVYYEYDVSNHLYKENMHVSQDYPNIIGYRFFAKFNPNKPKNCYIILDKPALSKFWDAPPGGWEKIPE